jgi:hypothetical protein
MKPYHVLVIGLVALTGFAAVAADATSASKVYSADLTRFNPDSLLDQSGSIIAGTLEVDLSLKEIRLTLSKRFRCPKNVICAQMMPAPVEIALAIVSDGDAGCGRRTLVARKDRADGTYEELRVTDNTKSSCSEFNTNSATEIAYTHVDQPSAGQMVSTFEAGRLSRVKEVALNAWQ